MKAPFPILLILLLACAPARAQEHALSGTVADAETGAALSGANVLVRFGSAGSRGTVTNVAGRFDIGVPPGRIVLRISFVGYLPYLDTLDVRGSVDVDVLLREQPYGLDSIQVVGRRDEDPVTSPLMSSVRISVEEAQRLPSLLGEIDVLKTIQLLPGVQSGTEGSTGLYVRGGGPDQNLVLLDGAPIYNPSHVFGFLSVFNPEALRDAYLVKGAFPARYGGRLSSVVDLQTRRGSRESYQVDGAVGLVMSSLTAQGPMLDDRSTFIVSARRTYIDVLARPFLNRRLEDGQSVTSYFYDVNARLDHTVSERHRLSLIMYWGQDVYGFTNETVDEAVRSPFSERHHAVSDWANSAGVLRWHTALSSRLNGSAALTFSQYRFDVMQQLERSVLASSEMSLFEQIEYGSGITDWSGVVDAEWQPHADHRVRFGANVTRHGFNPGVSSLSIQVTGEQAVDSTLTPGAFPFSGVEAFTYVEDDLELGSRLRLNVGLHGSALFVNGTTHASIQPRLSGRYLIDSRWSVKASFGTMQQYLHLLTNTGLNLPTDLWVAATDRIGPQKAWQAAVGTARTFADDRFLLSIEGYYKAMTGLLEYAPGASFVVPNEDWQDKVEVGEGRSYGLELLLRRRVGQTTGWIGYTLSWSDRQFDALNGGTVFPYRYDRRHDIAVALSHRWSDRLDLGFTWVYGTGQALTIAESRYFDARVLDPGQIATPSRWSQLRTYGERGGYRMRSYHRLDVVLNWHFDAVLFLGVGESTLSVGAYNSYNRLNPFYLFETRQPDGTRVFKQASLFPILPFISYRFHF